MKNGGASALRNRGRVAVIASALMMTSALVPVMFATPALAQITNDAKAGQNGIDGQYAFDIPAQSLTSALAQFGVQTGLQVTVDGALARDVQAGAVSGTMRADSALETLLRGTGLDYDVTGDGTVVIEPLVTGAASQGEVLDPVRVEANASETRGPIDAVTNSYVAARSLTASKTDTAIIDEAASVSVITQKELETRNVQRVAEALGYTSGVTIDLYGTDQRSDFASVRGFYQPTLGNYRDGLPQRVYNFTNSRQEPYGLQQIDVLKGSTSSLFGLNGPGGLVNAITKRPEDDARGEVFTTFGENHIATGGDVTGPIADDSNWTYRLTGLWQDAEYSQDYSQDDRIYIAPAFTYKPKAGTELTILTNYSNRKNTPGYGFPQGVEIDPDTFLGEPDFNRYDTEQTNIGYQLSHQLTDQLAFRQNTRYTHIETDYEQVYGAKVDSSQNRTAFAIYGELDRFAIDNQFQYDTYWGEFDSKSLVGLDYNRDQNNEVRYDGSATGINVFNPSYCGISCVNVSFSSEKEITQSSYGLYAQEQLTVYDDWIVTLGGRYDYVQSGTETINTGAVEERNDQAFTSRAGLTYKVTDGLSVYGNYSESFQPIYSNTSSMDGEAKPQEGTQYEVGVKYKPENFNALFTAAVYDLTQTNVGQWNASYSEYRQVGEVNSQGLELEAKMSPLENMNVTLAYSFIDAEVKKDVVATNIGKRPASVPENSASAWLDYTFEESGARGDLTVGAGVRYVGQTFADNAETKPAGAYAVADAMINYMITDDVSFAVNVTNLLDRKYVSYSYSDDYYGPGRSVLGTLKYTW
ncbi:TonB-dependent siderophore receptor [Thalassospira lucentensis]|uniref:TonB-dependent siderophore receptor n=1 Tax=Thalassospira lucentensis TaxID=168935 RepID=UPI003D2F085F